MLEHLTTCKNNEVRFQSKIYSDFRAKYKKRKEIGGGGGSCSRGETKKEPEGNIGKYIIWFKGGKALP